MIHRFSLLVRLIAGMFTAILAAVLITGCDGRELCYDHSHKVPVSIEFDWSLAPEARPKTMVVWFFPTDGSQGLRFELLGGGNSSRVSFDTEVRVPEGSYHMVCHNGSTDFNTERGSGIDNYEITTYDVSVLSAMNRDDNAPLPDGGGLAVRSQASTLYAHTLPERLEVIKDSNIHHRVVFRPAEMSIVCDIEITNVENLTSEVTVSGVLTGASESYHAGSMTPTDTRVAVPFAFEKTGPDSLHGSMVLFGLSGEHKLRIYTSYKYYYDIDVTGQIREQEGRRHIRIKIPGLKLPVSSSGMTPGVNDWGEIIDQPITM